MTKGPSWAAGCGLCAYGLIDPPPARIPAPLYVIRAIHLDKGYLEFCDCPAGQMQRRYLQGKLEIMIGGADRVEGHYWQAVIADAKAWQLEQRLPVAAPPAHYEEQNGSTPTVAG